MTGLAIGLIKARDEISEVVVVVAFFVFFMTKPLGRGSWTHLSLFLFKNGSVGKLIIDLLSWKAYNRLNWNKSLFV